MNEDRRDNYRAAIENENGRLDFGRRSCYGTIENESAGGFCFITSGPFDIEVGAVGKVAGNNRFPSAVQVAYVEPLAECSRIGLQRTEMIRTEWKPAVRPALFRIPRLTLVAIGVLAGLALGLLVVRQGWTI
jgi:hypothetical protein